MERESHLRQWQNLIVASVAALLNRAGFVWLDLGGREMVELKLIETHKEKKP